MAYFHPGASFNLTSRFSNSRRLMGETRPHKGVDFSAAEGVVIPAAGDGIVVLKKFNGGGYGHYLMLEHRNPDGEVIHTLYAHMKEPSSLKIGDRVKKGHAVGLVGTTGRSTGPHLHFEVHRHRKLGQPLVTPREEVDPLFFDISGLRYSDQEVTSDSNIKSIDATCLPITKSDGMEFSNAKTLVSLLGDEANFILGLNTWHGGIHITDKKAPWIKDTHPIRCMADGEVVAFRMMPDYLISKYKGRDYRYSSSFCLIRHRFKQKEIVEMNEQVHGGGDKFESKKNNEQCEFTYYTLYMHLCPWDKWPTNNRFRLKKEWRVRHSVPCVGYQPPSLTLKAGEEFEYVEGEERKHGYVTGQGEFEFARVKILSKGNSSKEVLATEGMDNLWMAQDVSAIEKVGNVGRPFWIYDQVEAIVKHDMVGRADPKIKKGVTGYHLAGDPAFNVSAGSIICFDSHKVELHEIRGRGRRMGRCLVQPIGRPVWLCVEDENIDVISQTPNHLGKLYELPNPVPIRAGDTIGFLGLYESPASIEGGMLRKHIVHTELFSDDTRVDRLLNTKKWKECGFTLIDGSASDGALDPANMSPFFLNVYRYISPDQKLKGDEVTVDALERSLDDFSNYEKINRIVIKHVSEWWSPASKAMMERFSEIFNKESELSLLIKHEVERVENLGWMDKLVKLPISGPLVWHLHPFSLMQDSEKPILVKNFTKSEFVTYVYQSAKENQKVSLVPAEITAAQAILETGYGSRVPIDINTGVYSFNLFGIKAHGHPEFVESYTHEYENNIKIIVVDKFRRYNSFDDSINGRVEFFMKNKRYHSLLGTTNPVDWAHGLKNKGYATDPDYANKLIYIMKTHGWVK